MAYAEKRGNLWRARWRAPDGTLESKPGFLSRKDAEKYAHDQEAAIRNNTYIDPKAGQITLTEWVNKWYPALDLEPTTLANYRYAIEVHILPEFGARALGSLSAQEIGTWEMQITARGYARRTARDARTTLTTILGDAIPRHIQVNPAQRKRGKGRKGQRRIERNEQAERYGRRHCKRSSSRSGAPRYPAAIQISSWSSRWPTPGCGGANSSAWPLRSFAVT
jgi:Phage integrase, N-terminal SAM-like domain